MGSMSVPPRTPMAASTARCERRPILQVADLPWRDSVPLWWMAIASKPVSVAWTVYITVL